MVKYLLCFLFMFFLSASVSFAKTDAQLQSDYGTDLSHAPFFLRFAFEKKNGKDWKEATYAERRLFLREYQTSLAAEKYEERAEAKADADKEKERLLEQKMQMHAEKERLSADLKEAKDEQREYDKRQADFTKAIVDEQKEIQRMEDEFLQEREDPKISQ